MESVISVSEVEFYIETMQPQDIQKIGNPAWIEWHQRLQKLSQEALLEASQIKEEHVKETLVSFQKLPILVHEAIVINVWKHKILPHLMKFVGKQEGSFMIYTILYHEVVSAALLELVLFHSDGAESLGDSAGDLLDYAYGCASKLLSLQYKEIDLKENPTEEIERHKSNLSLEVGMKCLSILRYISENLEQLPISVTNQMYNTYDVPLLLIQLLTQRPWIINGKQYVSGKLIEWDRELLPQSETQVWLAIRQLLLGKASYSHYPITDTRRTQISKLLPLLTPVIMDQISPLMELKDAICRLTMSGDNRTSAPQKAILLEVVLEMKESILNSIKGQCKKIAKEQFQLLFTKDHNKLVEMAKTLSDAYNTELIEKFEEKRDNPCERCGKSAQQKCSRCKEVSYCSRSCQVDDWPTHKLKCNQ